MPCRNEIPYFLPHRFFFLHTPPKVNRMDFDDDEAPPLLVDVEAQENAEGGADRIRVPITIVTGSSHLYFTIDAIVSNSESQDTLEQGRQRS